MLKHCSPAIEKYLSEAFNMSFSKRKFPEFLKLAKVVPIFKRGDKTSPENYRPISLLCSISKIFEKLLYNRMVQFFVNRKLFASEQFGFRKKRSCVHAISTVTDYIREKIDKKSTGQACFIDLQKAFDTLDHSILLKTLYAYGYRGPIFDILMDYLANRYQYIETVNDRTDTLQINTGVPQGSILGPFLFLVYINDLPSYIGNISKIAIFADDTSIVKAGPRNQCFLQTDSDRINNWFCYNKLSLIISKCEVVNFGIGIPNDLTLNNEKLPKRNSCKYLGVHLDKKLRFHDHIEHIVTKLNKFSGMIYKVRDIYPIKCLLMFYNSFAKSIISYGILTYGSAAKSNLYNIEKAQRRILRAIFFRNKYDSVGFIFERNKISTVFEIYLIELFAEVFKQ